MEIFGVEFRFFPLDFERDEKSTSYQIRIKAAVINCQTNANYQETISKVRETIRGVGKKVNLRTLEIEPSSIVDKCGNSKERKRDLSIGYENFLMMMLH